MTCGGADLHFHSRHSDGTDDPARLVERAATAGLEAVSLTDHDTVEGVEEARETGARLGVRVVVGVEFSAEFLGHEIHLLAYAFDSDAAPLRLALKGFRQEREQRAERIVERLNDLGIGLTMARVQESAAGASLGRPHLAEALLRARVVSTLQEAFDRFLNPGRPAFIPRARFPLESAKQATEASGGVLVLAHPHLNLSSGNIRALVEAGIDGLETVHPRLKPAQCRELASLAAEREILGTGGSDFHGERRGPVRIGSVRIPLEVVDRIEAMAARRAPGGASGSGTRHGGGGSMISSGYLDRAGLGDIARKVAGGRRLSREDGIVLFEHPDLNAVGALANQVRERLNGNVAYYNINQHINPTNICDKFCKFCAFYRTSRDADAYALSFEQIQARVRQKIHEPITEIHMVGGVNPDLPLEYYLDMIRAVHEVRPEVHVKALTMVEVADFARRTGRSVEAIIRDLKQAGIGSFPGGGAEVMSARLHRLLFPKKIDFHGWLDCAKTAHRVGLKSNATMLYGHIETTEEKVDHLILLREAQDETGGFMTFIPLAFHPENTKLDHLKKATAVEDLRNIAVARLMLDNFPHIKAFWIMITPRVAQIALSYGADDMDGTVTTEEIVHAAGAETSQNLTRRDLVNLIQEAGRDPMERDTLYRPVQAESVTTAPLPLA